MSSISPPFPENNIVAPNISLANDSKFPKLSKIDAFLDENFPTKFSQTSKNRSSFPNWKEEPWVWTSDCLTIMIHGISGLDHSCHVKLKCREVEYKTKTSLTYNDFLKQDFQDSNLLVCRMPMTFTMLLLHTLKVDVIPSKGQKLRGRIPLRWTVCGQCRCNDLPCHCDAKSGHWKKSISLHSIHERNPESDSEDEDGLTSNVRMSVSLYLSFTGKQIHEMLNPLENPFVDTFVLAPIVAKRIRDARLRARQEILTRQTESPRQPMEWDWEPRLWTSEDLQRLLILEDLITIHDDTRFTKAIQKAIKDVERRGWKVDVSRFQQLLNKNSLEPQLEPPPRTISLPVSPIPSPIPSPTISAVQASPIRSTSPGIKLGRSSTIPYQNFKDLSVSQPMESEGLLKRRRSTSSITSNTDSTTFPQSSIPSTNLTRNTQTSFFLFNRKQNFALRQAISFTAGIFKEDWKATTSIQARREARELIKQWSFMKKDGMALSMQRVLTEEPMDKDTLKDILPKRLHILKYAMLVYGWMALNLMDFKNVKSIFNDLASGDIYRFCHESHINDMTNNPFNATESALLHWHAPGTMGGEAYDPTFCIVLDKSLDAIIWSIRGTNDMEMAITDLAAEYDWIDHGLPSVCHGGFQRTARWMLHQFYPRLWLFCEHYKPKELILTGHSLGAGVATMLCILLNRDEQLKTPLERLGISIKSIAYATPGVVSPFSQEGLECEHWIMTNDNVPSLTYGSCLDWRELNRLAQVLIKSGEWKGKDKLEVIQRASQRLTGEIGYPKLTLPGTSHYMWSPSMYQDLSIPMPFIPEKWSRGTILVNKVPDDFFTPLTRDILSFPNWMFTEHLPSKYIVNMNRCLIECKGGEVVYKESQVVRGDVVKFSVEELEEVLKKVYL